MDVRIIGNFDVEMRSVNPSFSKSGWWYSYFEGDSIQVSDLQEPISLEPGEYRIYTSKRLGKPDITAGISQQEAPGSSFHVYPNPVSGMLYLEPTPEKSRITVISNSGQLVRILEMDSNQDQVDLSFLSPGFYVLSRQSGTEAPQYVKVFRE
jgi:hypothetical protein